MTVRLLPYGPGAWLVEATTEDSGGPPFDPATFAAAVRRLGDPAIGDVVPAARTVLVRLEDHAARDRVGTSLAGLDPAAGVGDRWATVVDVPVDYDGDDLDAVASACGLATDEVVERHAAATYTCAFCGFAPGFAYLAGLDPALHLPRRPTPRTRVPVGAVAVAADYTAVYPSPSPGGWHLIGTTTLRLWDPGRDRPALIRPGDTVRFHRR